MSVSRLPLSFHHAEAHCAMSVSLLPVARYFPRSIHQYQYAHPRGNARESATTSIGRPQYRPRNVARDVPLAPPLWRCTMQAFQAHRIQRGLPVLRYQTRFRRLRTSKSTTRRVLSYDANLTQRKPGQARGRSSNTGQMQKSPFFDCQHSSLFGAKESNLPHRG